MSETKQDVTYLERAVNQWLEHCKQVGHKPMTDGGQATYRYSVYTNRVFCCAVNCGWKEEVKPCTS